MGSGKSILFIVPAPTGISPGQRFRFEHYLSSLHQEGFRYTISNFYSEKGWRTIYTSGNNTQKALIILRGFLKRLFDLMRCFRYSYVYVYREAAPVGPPFFEWTFCKIFRKKMIYDFDDAIWIPVTSEYNKTASRYKNFSKIGSICRLAYHVTVGNEFLENYARKFNESTSVIPTVVNTTDAHNVLQKQFTNNPSIGWTGTFSTLPYLNLVIPVLQRLQEKYDFTFYVIADKDPELPLKNFRFIKWKRETETDDLLNFHIGLMPLHDDEISRGKCGFKAIQYMSLGIPALVSPVGVNTKIVDNGVNGFICEKEDDWYDKMELLLNNPELREKMGAAARNKIQSHYSVKATAGMFLSLFS
jgi:glycosyltransferase involved in cell wall biosynthesis